MELAQLRKLIEEKLGPSWENVPWEYRGREQFKSVKLPDGTELPCLCGAASKGGFSPGDLTGFEAVVDDTQVMAHSTLTAEVYMSGEVRHAHCYAVILQLACWQCYLPIFFMG